MITYIKGEVIDEGEGYIVILTSGIGYTVYTNVRPTKGTNDLELWTYHHVGSDYQHSLYGFPSRVARTMFLTLLKVQGVGPKIAQKIIESGNIDDLQQAISEGNINYFTRVKGMGKKGAQKIILELKNTLLFTEKESLNSNESVVNALRDLGFTQSEIVRAFAKLDLKDKLEEEILEESLKLLGS